jgi:zinc/manganese transport system permease protein
LLALALGFDARAGLFVVTVLVALGLGRLGSDPRADDVVTGGVFAWVLGVGVLLLSINTRIGDGAGVSVLFGSIFGISASQAGATAVIATLVAVAILSAARRLLYASLDPEGAAAHGVPVRWLGYGLLAATGVTVAQASQVVGSLLILGLLAAPAGAAARLTNRPLVGLALSAGLAVLCVWLGLAASYAVPGLPPSFCILAFAVLAYCGAIAASAGARLASTAGSSRCERNVRVLGSAR